MLQQCPGQDGRSWSPDDVSEKNCPECGYSIEFFKFDLMRECPDCGKKVINPRFNLECAEWCDQEAICIGEGSTLYKEVQTLRERMEKKIEKLFSGDDEMIERIEMVTDLADRIGKREQYSPLSVILSALLHPLGLENVSVNVQDLNLEGIINNSIDETKSDKGLVVARKILQDLDIPEKYRDEILRNLSALGDEKEAKKRENISYLVLADALKLRELKKKSMPESNHAESEIREALESGEIKLETEGALKVAENLMGELTEKFEGISL